MPKDGDAADPSIPWNGTEPMIAAPEIDMRSAFSALVIALIRALHAVIHQTSGNCRHDFLGRRGGGFLGAGILQRRRDDDGDFFGNVDLHGRCRHCHSLRSGADPGEQRDRRRQHKKDKGKEGNPERSQAAVRRTRARQDDRRAIATLFLAALDRQLLVAPPDVEHPDFPPVMEGFAPIPRARLPFPSLVVASRNDPFADFERSRALADAWGSRFVDAGHSGHLNADAGFGPWPLGERLLAELLG